MFKCTKIQFSKKAALLSLKRQIKDGRIKKKDGRVYVCPMCKFWHITSLEIFDERKIELLEVKEIEKWNKLLENE